MPSNGLNVGFGGRRANFGEWLWDDLNFCNPMHIKNTIGINPSLGSAKTSAGGSNVARRTKSASHKLPMWVGIFRELWTGCW